MLKARIAGVAAAVVVTGLGIVTAQPAGAAWSNCPSGALCAYLHPNGGGTPGKVYGNNRNLAQYTKFRLAESLYNHGTRCDVRIFRGLGYTGPSYVLRRGSANPTLTGTVWWHHVYSNRWGGCA